MKTLLIAAFLVFGGLAISHSQQLSDSGQIPNTSDAGECATTIEGCGDRPLVGITVCPSGTEALGGTCFNQGIPWTAVPNNMINGADLLAEAEGMPPILFRVTARAYQNSQDEYMKGGQPYQGPNFAPWVYTLKKVLWMDVSAIVGFSEFERNFLIQQLQDMGRYTDLPDEALLLTAYASTIKDQEQLGLQGPETTTSVLPDQLQLPNGEEGATSFNGTFSPNGEAIQPDGIQPYQFQVPPPDGTPSPVPHHAIKDGPPLPNPWSTPPPVKKH